MENDGLIHIYGLEPGNKVRAITLLRDLARTYDGALGLRDGKQLVERIERGEVELVITVFSHWDRIVRRVLRNEGFILDKAHRERVHLYDVAPTVVPEPVYEPSEDEIPF